MPYESNQEPGKKTSPASANTAKNKAGERATTVLVLQGGGALGSYQAGVYEGMADAGIHPDWVAGISIGALNAAIIAGNPPEKRVEQLRAFWEYICRQPWSPHLLNLAQVSPPDAGSIAAAWPPAMRSWFDSLAATRAIMEGQNGFFIPRSWTNLSGGGPQNASFYDTQPLRATLERFADFDRINDSKEMRVSVGAVNVRNGNFVYFDNTLERLRPEHFMASGALPPGFPAVEIDGEFYWDGGLVSNTPLFYVLGAKPRQDALIFQIDLWSARGDVPDDLFKVLSRQKDIQYSSRTRMVTSYMEDEQKYRRLLNDVLKLVPEAERQHSSYKHAAELACNARRSIIHLIYRDKPYEGHTKDFQFGMVTMNEHWGTGLEDIRHTLQHPQWLEMPSAEHSFVTHDAHRLHAR